jgi:nucleotide-binding universal stress UspA family protein
MKALLALDGSLTGESILPTAQRLSDLIPDLELHVLTVLDPKAVHGTMAAAVGDVKGVAAGTLAIRAPAPRIAESRIQAGERVQHEALVELSARTRGWFGDVEPELHATWSREPAKAIVEWADELDADVIVLATHGRSGISHLLAGSVAEAVIRNSRRPVLVQCPREGA